MRVNAIHFWTLIVFLAVAIDVDARSFRVRQLPNGSAIDGIGCVNCHFSIFGGDDRNPFGQAVEKLVTPNGQQNFWSEALAALDSDGDGFTNGEELQDPSGTWRANPPFPGIPTNNPGDPQKVTNPGNPQSVPPVEATVTPTPSSSPTPTLTATPSLTPTRPPIPQEIEVLLDGFEIEKIVDLDRPLPPLEYNVVAGGYDDLVVLERDENARHAIAWYNGSAVIRVARTAENVLIRGIVPGGEHRILVVVQNLNDSTWKIYRLFGPFDPASVQGYAKY